MRLAVTAAVLLLGLAACHGRTSRSLGSSPAAASDSSSDAAFWQWFALHQEDVAKIKRGDEPFAGDLARELRKIDPQLTFELGVATETHEVIISADGIKSAFPIVKRLVAAAPTIPGWRVIAFRPRKSTDFSIELNDGTRLACKDISYRVARSSGGQIDVVLYVNGATTLSPAVKQAVFLLLDTALGEYDVETRLDGIDIEPGAAAPKDAHPLSELPQAVDALK